VNNSSSQLDVLSKTTIITFSRDRQHSTLFNRSHVEACTDCVSLQKLLNGEQNTILLTDLSQHICLGKI